MARLLNNDCTVHAYPQGSGLVPATHSTLLRRMVIVYLDDDRLVREAAVPGTVRQLAEIIDPVLHGQACELCAAFV